MDSIWMTISVVLYLLAIGYLGWRGYQTTAGATDFLLAGRKTHPYIMAMSYGATFISTAAIVGFGGAAGVFGMGLLWLTVLNIFCGIFLAFVLFGGRTRRMGLRLDAHTFPELLGRRFDSRFIQGAAAVLIFVFMPLYASAVLIGAAKYLSQQLGIPYEAALFAFSALVALYVLLGGMKGVMYSDALQGTVMLCGMVALLVLTYRTLGGFGEAHRRLTELAPQVPASLQAGGHRGWTAMPAFGSPLWWTLVSTIVMGVGIGVLAQPQLAVRYMTVKGQRELNRAVPVGGVFILMMTGVAFVVGALTNVYFAENVGGHEFAIVSRTTVGEDGEPEVARRPPVLARLAPAPDAEAGIAVEPTLRGSVSIVAAAGQVEQIIPMFITSSTPAWFAVLFMLTLLSAAMSTISSQVHAMGTSAGRDFYEQALGLGRGDGRRGGMLATRVGVVIGVLLSVYLGYYLEYAFGGEGVAIVARGTAIFFGVCACAFLPMYVGGLWSRSITKAGAIAGMLAGTLSSVLWMLFVHETSSRALLLCQALFGRTSLALRNGVALRTGPFVWPFVDPLIIGLPLAIVVTVGVSMATRKMPAGHVERCFGK